MPSMWTVCTFERVTMKNSSITPALVVAHAAIMAFLASIMPHFYDKEVTLATIGRVLAKMRIPHGIATVTLTFAKVATAMGFSKTDWFKSAMKALADQAAMTPGSDVLQQKFAPFHDVVIGELQGLDMTASGAKATLRTLASLVEISLVPGDSIQTIANLIESRATDGGFTDKTWIKMPLLALAAQSEMKAGELDIVPVVLAATVKKQPTAPIGGRIAAE